MYSLMFPDILHSWNRYFSNCHLKHRSLSLSYHLHGPTSQCTPSAAHLSNSSPSTSGQVIVVSVRPQLRVLFTHALEAGAVHVPLIDWQFVVIRVGSGVNMVDPVLTFARKSTVYFYQVRQMFLCVPTK